MRFARGNMRDLGTMGESTFSHWCASAGMTANYSKIDRTGWDFHVEFDFPAADHTGISTIHNAASECRVQVKSTDKKLKSVPVSLKNLRRLVTARMPAFFAVLEFDGKEQAQRAYVVHVDDELSLKILKRLSELEQDGASDRLHKHELCIPLRPENLLDQASGASLESRLKAHIGPSMSEYIVKKNEFLHRAGFDDGFADMTFTASGEESLSKLISMSLGMPGQLDVAELTGFAKRFGKRHNIPFLSETDLKLEMVDVKPTHEGVIKFRTEKTGPAFVFPAQVFNTSLNAMVPEELRKIRIATPFFNILFPLHKGSTKFSCVGIDEENEVQTLLNALRFLQLISTPEKRFFVELSADGLPTFRFEMHGAGMSFSLENELSVLKAASNVLDALGVPSKARISLSQARRYGDRIREMESVLGENAKSFHIEMPQCEEPLVANTEVVCLTFVSTPVGNVWVGAFLSFAGFPYTKAEGGYSIYGSSKTVEQFVVRDGEEPVPGEDILAVVDEIELKYKERGVRLVVLFDKQGFVTK